MSATSKNNPDKRRVEGWRCAACGTTNPSATTTCTGQQHTRLLAPKAHGRGWTLGMIHEFCGKAR